jgi:predicted DNA-binding protein
MAEVTITLSTEELQRLKALGEREGLTIDQIVRLGVQDLINQPDDTFQKAAERILQKNAELYRRLA